MGKETNLNNIASNNAGSSNPDVCFLFFLFVQRGSPTSSRLNWLAWPSAVSCWDCWLRWFRSSSTSTVGGGHLRRTSTPSSRLVHTQPLPGTITGVNSQGVGGKGDNRSDKLIFAPFSRSVNARGHQSMLGDSRDSQSAMVRFSTSANQVWDASWDTLKAKL